MDTTLAISGPARQTQMASASKVITTMVPERDTGPGKVSSGNCKAIPHRSLAGELIKNINLGFFYFKFFALIDRPYKINCTEYTRKVPTTNAEFCS